MTTVIEVPKEYGYVLVTAVGSFLLGMWHGIRITPFRKAAGIPHPNFYAPVGADCKPLSEKSKEAHLFNCAQRAHGHYMEHYPFFITGLLVSGLKFPKLSAACGVAWMACRVVYAVGYTNPNHEKGRGRLPGMSFLVPQATMGFLILNMAYDLLTS